MKTKIYTILPALLFVSFAILLGGCDDYITGSGKVITEERDAEPFHSIEVSGSFKIYLSQDEEHSLTLEADDNLMQYVESSVRNGKLYLSTKGIGFRNLQLAAYITAPDLDQIKASGAVSIITEAPVDYPRLKIEASGAAKMDLELYSQKTEIVMSGAGKAYLSGECEEAYFRISGAANLNADKFYCRLVDVRISGAGKAKVNVEDDLTAKISGAGDISYRGNPSTINQSISGAGKIRQIK